MHVNMLDFISVFLAEYVGDRLRIKSIFFIIIHISVLEEMWLDNSMEIAQ